MGNDCRRRFHRLEKKDGRLPTSAPADELTMPTTAAMIISNGHRLCEVGSLAVSIATRARTAAGTAAPNNDNNSGDARSSEGARGSG